MGTRRILLDNMFLIKCSLKAFLRIYWYLDFFLWMSLQQGKLQKQCNVSHQLCACPLRAFFQSCLQKSPKKKVSFSCNLAGEVQTSQFFLWNGWAPTLAPKAPSQLGNSPHTGWGRRTWRSHRLYPRLPLRWNHQRCKVESFKDGSFSMWMFPKIVVPPNHPILIGCSILNHPFWGYPYFWKHPCKFQLIWTLFDWLMVQKSGEHHHPKDVFGKNLVKNHGQLASRISEPSTVS